MGRLGPFAAAINGTSDPLVAYVRDGTHWDVSVLGLTTVLRADTRVQLFAGDGSIRPANGTIFLFNGSDASRAALQQMPAERGCASTATRTRRPSCNICKRKKPRNGPNARSRRRKRARRRSGSGFRSATSLADRSAGAGTHGFVRVQWWWWRRVDASADGRSAPELAAGTARDDRIRREARLRRRRLYSNDVLPAGEGEFETNGLDRAWWGRLRGNTIGGHHYSGFQTSWGRHQYDTYFGDPSDGLPGHHDPFYVGADSAVAGAPRGVRIAAIPMPDDIYGNPSTGGANWTPACWTRR